MDGAFQTLPGPAKNKCSSCKNGYELESESCTLRRFQDLELGAQLVRSKLSNRVDKQQGMEAYPSSRVYSTPGGFKTNRDLTFPEVGAGPPGFRYYGQNCNHWQIRKMNSDAKRKVLYIGFGKNTKEQRSGRGLLCHMRLGVKTPTMLVNGFDIPQR